MFTIDSIVEYGNRHDLLSLLQRPGPPNWIRGTSNQVHRLCAEAAGDDELEIERSCHERLRDYTGT